MMSNQFDLENDINFLVRLDAPVQGPIPRWQRRALESASCNNSFSTSLNSSSQHLSMSKNGTPMKVLNCSLSQSRTKTPKSGTPTPADHSKTPGKSKTPNKGVLKTTPSRACRFIPNRLASNMENGQFKYSQSNEPIDHSDALSNIHYNTAMTEQLNNAFPETKDKILAFQEKPIVSEGFQNKTKLLYSSSKKGEKKLSGRHIPSDCDRILDAPDMVNDYYLNLIDWGSRNLLAVALQGALYLWDGNTGDANLLLLEEQYLSAVKWMTSGKHLSIGTSTAEIQLWDVVANKRIRNMKSHAGRVSSLSWNEHILSSGSADGFVHFHDVRIMDHHIKTLQGHVQEVCGLEWSPDLKHLATGGNDNLVNIYDMRQDMPLCTFTEHQGAVKGVAWCPWQPNLLATGGGTSDRNIKLWNVASQTLVKSVDTNSQVCAIKWSVHYKELISAHGFANNQLTVWSYPSMNRIQELMGHTARILFLAMSPDGQVICSGSADETLRMWNCFAVDARHRKKISYHPSNQPNSKVNAFTSLR